MQKGRHQVLDTTHNQSIDSGSRNAGAIPAPRRLYSVRQAEDYSGDSRSTLYAAMKAGTLKFVKMGRSTRIEHDDLDRYIDAKIAASS